LPVGPACDKDQRPNWQPTPRIKSRSALYYTMVSEPHAKARPALGAGEFFDKLKLAATDELTGAWTRQVFAASSACFVPRRSSRSSCSAFLLGQACPRSGGSAYKSRGGRFEDVSSIARATPVRRAQMRAARAALRVCARSLTPGWRSSTSCTDRPASPLTRSSCIRSSPSAASATNSHQGCPLLGGPGQKRLAKLDAVSRDCGCSASRLKV
jgi:hypothetical protein